VVLDDLGAALPDAREIGVVGVDVAEERLQRDALRERVASWPYVRFRQPFWPFDTALVNAGVAIAGFCSSSAVMSDEIENGLAPASPLLAPRVNPYQSWLLVRLAL
jgi:hypothetical protein